jgi:hypothetical protein
VPDILKLDVPPGSYRLEVKALDRTGGRMGIYRQHVEVEAYDADILQVSDLELAWQVKEDIEEQRFRKGDLTVTPMASRTYKAGQSLFVYYEIYNLKQDEFGQTSYRVEYTILRREGVGAGNLISRLVQTFTGREKQEIAIGYERAGEEPFERVFVELDLPGDSSGKHGLRVRVTDLNDETEAAKEAVFQVTQ